MAIKVFFNNSCNICRFEINHYKKISDDSLEWVDITNNKDALSLTSKSQKELLRRLHVIDNLGFFKKKVLFLFINLQYNPSIILHQSPFLKSIILSM